LDRLSLDSLSSGALNTVQRKNKHGEFDGTVIYYHIELITFVTVSQEEKKAFTIYIDVCVL
jgi:hypothetical protein